MRRRLASLSLAALALGAAALAVPEARGQAPLLAPADVARIRAVVEGQLAAFQADDGPRAFGFAAPRIRALFGDPARFMAMVREAYRPVYRPREVAFRDLVTFDGLPAQRVLLVGPDGAVVIALYLMERQPDGSWLIAGCVLVPSDESTT
jgi:hypothetical protein